MGLHVGHLPLLLLVHGLLLGQVLGPLQFEVGVAAAVFVELAVLDMDDAIHHGIEEVAVVRNEHQRALIALEPLLQPDDGVEIQVVVGSSSSSRSERQSSAWARFRRIRQPPEKLLTGESS